MSSFFVGCCRRCGQQLKRELRPFRRAMLASGSLESDAIHLCPRPRQESDGSFNKCGLEKSVGNEE